MLYVNKLFEKYLLNIIKNIKEVKWNLEKNIFFIFDCIDFLEYLFNFLMFVNEMLDFDELWLNYILIFYKVKENIVKMLEYLLSEIVFILKLEILNSF